MHAKPDLRAVLKWMITRSGSVIAAVMLLPMHGVVPQSASEWESETDVVILAKAFRGRHWFPKLRLFAVACCRRVQDSFPVGPYCDAIEVAADFIHGQASKADLYDVRRELDAQLAEDRLGRKTRAYWDRYGLIQHVYQAALACTLPADQPARRTPIPAQNIAGYVALKQAISEGMAEEEAQVKSLQVAKAEAVAQTALIRKLVGNPFLSSKFPD